LYEKFMCYCRNSGGELEKSIGESEDKVSSLPAAVEEAEATLTQTKEDLKKAQVDRSAAKAAMEEATAIREKEAAAFDKESGDLKTNIAAIKKAVGALEKGNAGAFLQTQAASVLKNLVENDDKMIDMDREELTAFLSGTSASPSDAIVGILKQMGDTMAATLKDVTATEEDAIKSFDQLMKAKTAEVQALTEQIEEKTKRIGDLGVKIVGMKQDLTDAEDSLLEDKKFLAELEKGCATKEKEWSVICKLRSEELLALADTIKILNDDDALELFKKTLPGSASFMQITESTSALKSRALAVLELAKSGRKGDRQRLDVIMLAIRGKKVNFDKVIKMIDDMVALMKEEQLDDDHKKEYCMMQFDQADDKKKELVRAEGKLTASIEDAKESIATLTDEIKTLGENIKDLDKTVAEATENRKEENSDFKTLFASDSAAKEILAFAKNRLNKFYNPKLYKPDDAMLAQVRAHDAPPPPPPTAAAYSKKSEDSGGVIGMIDSLIAELDKELTEAETEERLAQEEYEELMADSAEKHATDSKSLSDKTSLKADTQDELVKQQDEHKATVKELIAVEEYISQLHAECDWLIQYFDVRKNARAGEVDALGKAKAVLSGADFSLIQTKSAKFLTRA
jgi:chromosome segregation ATPase